MYVTIKLKAGPALGSGALTLAALDRPAAPRRPPATDDVQHGERA